MKYLFSFALLIVSLSVQATELACTDQKILERRIPGGVALTQEDYSQFLKFIRTNYSYLMFSECSIVQYPEIYNLFKEVSEKKYDRKTSSFFKTPFAIEFLEKNKNLGLSWESFADPFEVISFPRFVHFEQEYIFMRMRGNEALPKEMLELLIQRYKESKDSSEKRMVQAQKNTVDIEKKRAEEELRKKDEEKKRNEEQKRQDEEEFRFVELRQFYISKLIEKKENVLKEDMEFIKKKFADDQNDFLQKVVLACYEMNCDSKLKQILNKSIKNNLKFEKYGGYSPAYFLIQYNLLKELKDLIKVDPESYITRKSFQVSAHLQDSKIYNYFKNELKFKYDLELEEFNGNFKQATIGSIALFDSMKNKRTGEGNTSYYNSYKVNNYNVYFMDKFRNFKAKHILGYAVFDSSSPEINTFRDPSPVKEAMTISEITQYAFENPSWDSKKKFSSKEESFFKNLKADEIYYEASGFEFNEIKNNWVGFETKEGKNWIHSSQIKHLVFIDEFINASLSVVENPDEIYDLPSGKLVAKPNGVRKENYIHVLQSKWVNDELWLYINLQDYACDGAQGDNMVGFNLWFKPFSGEKKNYKHYSRGC